MHIAGEGQEIRPCTANINTNLALPEGRDGSDARTGTDSRAGEQSHNPGRHVTASLDISGLKWAETATQAFP